MENTLKKEFNPRDVQRMRNIITGKTGDRTQIQTGWEKNNQDHKEGDVWEENSKTWTIKNGIKMTVTKLDKIKDLVLMPLCCPACNNVMKINDYNKKMWGIHKKCFDCVIKMESEIKRLGKWDEYCSNIMNRNKNAELDDLEAALEQWVDEQDSFVSEQGEVEKWGGGDKKAIYKQVKAELVELRKRDIYNGKNLDENAI
jgi:hypothetical protein